MLRLMYMRPLLAATATVVALTACTGSASDSKPTPDNLSLCRAALPGRIVVSAEPDTVEHFRQFSYGPGIFPSGGPLASAFPAAAPQEDGLWCWTENQPLRSYTAWAVLNGRAERGYTAGGQFASPPSGRPVGGG
jgi:hypothetical protein